MFYTCNYNIRVTHRNGAIKHIFYTNQIHGGSSAVILFILSLHALALHLAVKILLQIFLYEDLSTLALHTSVGCYFPQKCHRTHFVTQPILLSENIPNIWHKSSTKHKEVRPDWNDKNVITDYAPHRITWKSLQWNKVAILRNIRSSAEKDLGRLFYSELKRAASLHYICYLARSMFRIVLETITPC